MSPPLDRSGALGLPGRRSRKKLPSRNSLGRIVTVASSWIGRPSFSIENEGLPIHDDATVTIRPRLFLEGNFFLDLRPGSPNAPDLSSGGDIPVSQTATAVQLDEILTSLQKSNRTDLKQVLHGYGS